MSNELKFERLGDANKTYPASTLVIRKQFVDAAIDELKDKCQMHDFFWEGCGFAKRGFKNTIAVSEAFDKLEAENAELKAKLESVQASMYCDVVDANMENRRLKRALWLARANDASSFAGLFSTLSYIDDDESRTYWIFGNKRKIVIDGLKCSRMETAYKWFCIWDDVANKCLKKAEEYK